ncbi:WEB family protein [Senna tora]|uniref:WEB family protein n=1 Tax=Senna tora TaxID=362788 RepID=A0A834VY75_9FABA|nr:WEB family protein [Senna tora]
MGRQAKIQAMNRRGQNVYEEGGGSNARGGISGSGTSRVRLSESENRAFQLRSVDINLVRSRSMKQSKITGGLMKTLRKKLGEVVSKLIIYERLPMNLASSPWLHNLINSAAEIGGLFFFKSIDASDVSSRNTDYYFKLLDKVVEEVGEEYVVQVVTANEGVLKVVGKKLMEKRKHIYWTPCATHCIDLCLEEIGKKSNVKNVLENARLVTSFIYNHIWTVNLMKGFTRGREITHPAITRFATQFIQLQSIVKQKQALKEMFNSEKFRKSKFDKRWRFLHYDLHSAGYFLNPQFQYGLEHGRDVYRETMDETTKVINKLKRDMENQIRAINQKNAKWLPIDTDEEEEKGDNDGDFDSNEGDNGDGGLSPPSNNSGGNNDSGGHNNNDGGNQEIDEDTYQEVPYSMRNPNFFFFDMTHAISDARRGSSQSGRGHFQQLNMIDDSSSSIYSHSDSTYGIGESSQTSQGYPPLYHQPLPYQPQFPTNYQGLYHHPSSNFPYPQQMEQRGGGFFYYVFGEGYGGDNNQSKS